MNIYQRLNAARQQFHSQKLEKTGVNKFAGYQYFELGDFLIPALKTFNEVGLSATISFGTDVARMTIVNVDLPSETIVIESPMSSAALKGCHEVQNLGAVQTYLRRYLWVAALEIVEHDAIDSSQPKVDKPEPKKIQHSPTSGALVSQERMSVIAAVADAIKAQMAKDDILGAYEEAVGITDPEEKTALWGMLDSKTRSAIKKVSEQLKEQA